MREVSAFECRRPKAVLYPFQHRAGPSPYPSQTKKRGVMDSLNNSAL